MDGHDAFHMTQHPQRNEGMCIVDMRLAARAVSPQGFIFGELRNAGLPLPNNRVIHEGMLECELR